MDNLEEMKTMWIKLNDRLTRLEEENLRMAKEVKISKWKSSQDKLMTKYKMFMIIEIVMIIFILLTIIPNQFIEEQYRWITAIYWVIFFLGEFILDFYLLVQVENMDIYHSAVSEISKRAKKNWEIHKLAMIIGLPLAIGAIILYILSMGATTDIILPMICGIIVGLFIGIRELRRIYSYYKNLYS